ncbi:MAG: membrane protein insertase YidC [Candidatus Omnitrophica bacterium]|nr:membrane protein insertase YidC [Candidatus Omnitrophota bacterium]
MEKRLILAIALSLLVIIIFQRFVVTPPSKSDMERMGKETVSDISAKELHSLTEVVVDEREFDIQTDRYILTFSNIGGSIKRIQLKDYKNLNSNEPLNLVDIKNPKEYIFAIDEPSNLLRLDSSLYEFEKNDDTISYSLKLSNLEITKRYILHKSKHIIELRLIIKNKSGEPKEFGYRIIGGSGIIESNIQDKRFVEVVSNVDGRTLHFKHPKDRQIINPGIVTWTALNSKYFSIILKPFIQTKNQFYRETKGHSLLTGIGVQEISIPSNHFVEHKFILYAGPNKISFLKDVGLDETLSYGFFGGISKALLSLLRFFYVLVHNWGVSIILLSITLNIVLFPLSLKSFKSMQKMQELHPQMEKLKSQYKDNPQKLNKEIMELYKKHNINPFSGCLPLLLQMPIFIALYQGLIRSIELKSANFLWIKDLSMPDAVSIPFSLPLVGKTINILPIFMVMAMIIQQRISTKSMGGAVTEEQKQQQKTMLIVMPIMFGFIFYNMPSGLVLYWVVNTILTIVEQSLIFRKA